MTDNADPVDIFRQEAGELLEQLEAALLDLERSPNDQDLVNKAFRALHTIKGSGAMFGFEQVAAFAHEFESAFDRVRKGEAAPDPELIGIALNAKDFIRAQIENPAEADAVIGVCILADLRKLVANAGTGLPSLASVASVGAESRSAPAAASASKTWRIDIRFHKDVLVNGSNPLLLLDELRALGECRITVHAEDVPALEAMEPAACYLHWDAVLTTDHPRSAIDDVFVFVLGEMDLRVEEIERPLDETLAELAAASPASTSRPVNAPGNADASGAAEAKRGGGKEASTIRVQAERLDEMMDRVGELVIAQARLTQLAAAGGGTKGVAEEIERLTSALRDAMMGIRMLPIGSLFGRFRRLIHDLSRDLGKEIELVAVGEETELDKTMIERLADPLIHVIRNAADHGLEDAKTRRETGKPSAGHINLVARHAGAEVLISVGDDGKGLDASRIRAKAEENGLIAPGAVLSDAELHQYIFHPGFSTAKEVSALSGRGVGMDVVRRTIEGMRGSIDIATEVGKGTTFTLRLPLTLAIIEGLLVRVADTRYVVPLTAVEECVELSAADDVRSKGRSFLNIRGDLVPFLRLRELFGESGGPDAHQKVVIVAAGETRVGLVVDQIIGSHQTVIKSLSKLHADVPSFSGATILGDGAVALILDVPHLMALGQMREARLKSGNQEAA
ncbi:MAG TPA: chemotaxis protein CheA [Roseiarcus sp.]|jgi:two-component system chemotaxis sensor kinase CheA